MLYGSEIEKKLIETDYTKFTVPEKNHLVTTLATKDSVPFMEVTEAYILKHHKKIKKSIMNSKCEQHILAGFKSTTTNKTYRVSQNDQLNFIGLYLAVKEDINMTTVMWKTEEDGVVVAHTRDEFIAIYREAFNHKNNALIKVSDLRAKIEACATHADILLLNW